MCTLFYLMGGDQKKIPARGILPFAHQGALAHKNNSGLKFNQLNCSRSTVL